MRYKLKFGRALAALLIGMAALAGPNAAGRFERAEAAPRQGAEVVKAAFVRGGDLWVKEDGRQERRLTKGEAALNPRWSYDGQWLAYTRGAQQQELWVRRADGSGEGKLVSVEGGAWEGFAWSPVADKLAYQAGEKVYWLQPDRPDRRTLGADGVGRFSWWPDGSGFVASTAARLQPAGGWAQVRIVRAPLEAGDDPARYETLYTLPKQSDDFFAVDTSVFKWSADGRWMAFLAKPTASLSSDSDTLCVLSADGKTFQRLDTMVANADWVQWAGDGDRLAYIAGEGREATTNKRLKVADIPLAKPALYTPAGYVDTDFAWRGGSHIVVSRAPEQPAWQTEPAKRPLPFLVDVGLRDRRQERLTPKSGDVGAYDPVCVPKRGRSRLVWVASDRQTAKAMKADEDGSDAAVWIDGIDPASNYYEQWHWNETLQVYGGGRTSR